MLFHFARAPTQHLLTCSPAHQRRPCEPTGVTAGRAGRAAGAAVLLRTRTTERSDAAGNAGQHVHRAWLLTFIHLLPSVPPILTHYVAPTHPQHPELQAASSPAVSICG